MKAYWKFEALLSTHRKMTTLSIFASNCQWSSGKFRLSNYLLYDKRSVEYAILSFPVFSFLQHWHVFCQNDEFSKFYYVKIFYDLETFHIYLQKAGFVVYYF